MKRRDVMKMLADHAKAQGLEMRTREGGRHTIVYIGDRFAPVGRHNEIPEKIVRKIREQIGITK